MVSIWLSKYRQIAPSGVRETRTSVAYAADCRAFSAFVGKPLRAVTVRDVQDFAASLSHFATASAARRLSAVKSLLTFAHEVGFVVFNAGVPIKLPAIKDQLASRILSEADVQHMLRVTTGTRNAALIRLLYGAGLRISEACGLCWRDLTPRDSGGQITVFGKGGRTRNILLPDSLYRRISDLRAQAGPLDPVFRSRKGGPLRVRQVHDIIKSSAARAKLARDISAHWLRHAHVSHALDRGCPVHVVQATAGHASLTTTTRYTHVRPGDSSARYLTA